jgi:hypothetical protein
VTRRARSSHNYQERLITPALTGAAKPGVVTFGATGARDGYTGADWRRNGVAIPGAAASPQRSAPRRLTRPATRRLATQRSARLAVQSTTWRWLQRASGATQIAVNTALATARKRRLQREWRRLQRATRRAGRDTCCAGHGARRAHHDTHGAGCAQHDVALAAAHEWRRSNCRTCRAGHGAQAPAIARVASAAARDTPRRPRHVLRWPWRAPRPPRYAPSWLCRARRGADCSARAPATARVASAAARDTPRRLQRVWRRLRRATRSASAGYSATGSGCITIGVGSARRGDGCGTKHT